MPAGPPCLRTARRGLLASVAALLMGWGVGPALAAAPRPGSAIEDQVGTPGIALADDGARDVAAMLDAVVRHAWAEGRFQGSALVTRHGEVVHESHTGMADERAGRANAADTRYRLGSIGKPLTATAILQLRDAGLLDVDDSVARHLPDWDWEPAERVTLRQLLSHTSGVPRSVFDYVSGGITRTYTLDGLMRALRRARLEFEPGAQWQYSNAGYTILAAVIEEVSGQDYHAYLKQHVFAPAGMTETHIDIPAEAHELDAQGYQASVPGELRKARRISMTFAFGAGTFRTTVGDLVRWDAAERDGQLLSAESLALMRTPVLNGYGLGWWVGEYERPDGSRGMTLAHDGGIDGFSTALLRRVEDGEVIALMSNLAGAPCQRLAQDLERVLARGQPAVLARSGLQAVWAALQDGGLPAARAALAGLGRNARGEFATAGQVLGEPDAHDRDGWGHCWFGEDREARDEVELAWTPTRAVAVEIHGTARQQGLVGLRLRHADDGRWHDVPVGEEVRAFEAKTDGLGVTTVALAEPLRVDAARLDIDHGAVEGTNVLDAVGLVDADGTRTWVQAAEATSDRRAIAVKLGPDPPTEDALNDLGYALLQSDRVDLAVLVFRLNVELHPDAWNPHDSLGEGLLRKGHDAEALASYERSVELNPDNDGGRRAITRIQRALKR